MLSSQKLPCPEVHVVEMRMLRLMCSHIRIDKIRNEDICDKVGVTSVVDMMREARLRRCVYAPMRRCKRLVIESTRRGRCRPKKYCGELIRQDMMQLQVTMTWPYI